MSDLEKKLTKAIMLVMYEVSHKRGGPERSSCVSIPYVYRICRETLDLPVEAQKWIDEPLELIEDDE